MKRSSQDQGSEWMVSELASHLAKSWGTYLLQSWTKYLKRTLVFMCDSALRETFNFYYSAVFC